MIVDYPESIVSAMTERKVKEISLVPYMILSAIPRRRLHLFLYRLMNSDVHIMSKSDDYHRYCHTC